jgi:hypothetical protein
LNKKMLKRQGEGSKEIKELDLTESIQEAGEGD